jgi:hypothetical protein
MKMSAEKPAAKKANGRKVTHIRVKRLGNAFEVAHEREQPQNKGARMQMIGQYEPDPKPMAFAKHKDAAKHVAGLMEEMGPDEQGETKAQEGAEAS